MTLSDAVIIATAILTMAVIVLNIIAIIAMVFARRAIDRVLSSRSSRRLDAVNACSSSLSLSHSVAMPSGKSVVVPSGRKRGDANC